MSTTVNLELIICSPTVNKHVLHQQSCGSTLSLNLTGRFIKELTNVWVNKQKHVMKTNQQKQQCIITLTRAVTLEQAAAPCGTAEDWTHRCFAGLTPRTRNFSELGGDINVKK